MNLENRVEKFMERLHQQHVCMHGFILSVNGTELAKAYYHPFREGEMHRMFSVSKTFTGLAIGILAGEGKLQLDDRIVTFFPDWLPNEPDLKLMRLTVRDLLRMTSNHCTDTYRMDVDQNWAETYFRTQSTHEPGTAFNYDTSGTQVLAELVYRLSGNEVLDFLEQRLFTLIGANDPKAWLRDPGGRCWGGSGLLMSLRDLHRAARLCMNGGEGIVPETYLREMTKLQTPTPFQANEEERYGYGLLCWQTRDGWSMYGLGGQLAICCPRKDTLLVTEADTRLDPNGVQKIYDAFFEEIYPYTDSESMEPKSWSKTAEALEDSGVGVHFQEGPYFFEENPLTLQTLELRGNKLILRNADGCFEVPFGWGQNAISHFPAQTDQPAMASAGWITPHLLKIRCSQIGNSPCGIELLLSFEKEYTVTVQARRSMIPEERILLHFDGIASGYLKS